MHEDYEDSPAPAPRHYALGVWLVCAAVLFVPSLLVCVVRLWAFAAGCNPGPDLCRGASFGGGLRDTLNLAWFVGASSFVTFVIALTAAVAALICRRPLMAALTMLLFPILSLLLPTLIVQTALYDACKPNEAGVGDCTLWGAQMGMSFHRAAATIQPIYDLVPFNFALALMVGVIGFIFFRPARLA